MEGRRDWEDTMNAAVSSGEVVGGATSGASSASFDAAEPDAGRKASIRDGSTPAAIRNIVVSSGEPPRAADGTAGAAGAVSRGGIASSCEGLKCEPRGRGMSSTSNPSVMQT